MLHRPLRKIQSIKSNLVINVSTLQRLSWLPSHSYYAEVCNAPRPRGGTHSVLLNACALTSNWYIASAQKIFILQLPVRITFAPYYADSQGQLNNLLKSRFWQHSINSVSKLQIGYLLSTTVLSQLFVDKVNPQGIQGYYQSIAHHNGNKTREIVFANTEISLTI